MSHVVLCAPPSPCPNADALIGGTGCQGAGHLQGPAVVLLCALDMLSDLARTAFCCSRKSGSPHNFLEQGINRPIVLLQCCCECPSDLALRLGAGRCVSVGGLALAADLGNPCGQTMQARRRGASPSTGLGVYQMAKEPFIFPAAQLPCTHIERRVLSPHLIPCSAEHPF